MTLIDSIWFCNKCFRSLSHNLSDSIVKPHMLFPHLNYKQNDKSTFATKETKTIQWFYYCYDYLGSIIIMMMI